MAPVVPVLFLLGAGLCHEMQALGGRTTEALYGVQNPRLSNRRDFRLLHGSTYVRDHDEHVTMIPHAKITPNVLHFPTLFCGCYHSYLYIRLVSIISVFHC